VRIEPIAGPRPYSKPHEIVLGGVMALIGIGAFVFVTCQLVEEWKASLDSSPNHTRKAQSVVTVPSR
jgi:hypothetical protein